MKTIVSISPARVEADSRTFKQAASITRFGYTSVVIEGEASSINRTDLPFELRSINGSGSHHAPVEAVVETTATIDAGGERRGLKATINRLSPRLVGFVRWRYYWLLHFARYFYKNGILVVRRAPKAALYYLHSPTQFPAVYVLSKLYGAPFIYDAHDFYSRIEEVKATTTLVDRSHDRFLKWIEERCVKRAAAVVTVSEGLAALQHQAFGCRSVVIRNCQDPRLDRTPTEDLRQLLGLPPDAFLLVTVGQAKPGQSIRPILDAMCQLPEDVHLALVGKYYEQYLEDIRSRKLEGRVHLVAPVKPYEVVPFIRSADAALVLYYPRSVNYINCLPNGFFQCVTAELPLLYPELNEIKKIAEQYDLGIAIDPQSAESMRAAVMELITNAGKRLSYKQNVGVASRQLTWQNEEILLKDLITNAVSGRE